MPTELSLAGAQALARLEQLGSARIDGRLGRDDFRAAALAALAAGMECSRVSLWLYAPGGGPRRLHCEALHDAGAPQPAGAVLAEAEHPAYFAALDRDGFLCAPQALEHPALASMRESYLRPLDIRSLLDVPFAVNGRRVGLLCAEQPGRAIEWRRAQVTLMRRAGIVGSRVIHRLAENERCVFGG